MNQIAPQPHYTQSTAPIAPASVDLSGLDKDDLEAMAAAGERVLECQRVLAKTGDNVVGDVLRNQGDFYEWNHYPAGDVYDPEYRSQYYYHAHPKHERVPGEHGHFHTFLRPAGFLDSVSPLELPDFSHPKEPTDLISHIVGISMDAPGQALRLFTTNRWVTGETWYSAEHVIQMLRAFRIDHTRPSWTVNIWVSSMLVLFQPQIEALIVARDRKVKQWSSLNPDRNIYEDRELNVTSELFIQVPTQVGLVEQALRER